MGACCRGGFMGYENGQFIFELEDGRERRFRPSEVLRLVMERAGSGPAAEPSGSLGGSAGDRGATRRAVDQDRGRAPPW
jgi:hypothetical protein